MNKKTIYTIIYDLYELNNRSDQASIRRLISRHFKKEYPDKTWDELTLLEQHTFTHMLITKPIFDNYVQDEKNQNRIRRKIQKESKEMSLDIDIKLKEQNEINEKIMKQYYVESDTEQEKREAYKQLCEDYKAIVSKKDISQIYEKDFPQSYEEWSKNPLRIYDIIMDKSQELDSKALTCEEKSVPEEKINDTIIKTILKILKVEFKIEIDIQSITDCLTFLHNYERGDEFGKLISDYDPTLPLSKEEQQKIISMNKEYQQYTEMLDKLNFYKKEKA